MKVILLAIVVVLPTGLLAQNAIPSGTVLPLRLSSSLNSEKMERFGVTEDFNSARQAFLEISVYNRVYLLVVFICNRQF